ncbi:hypothetical protein DFH09DRAFT_1170781 [Mycena vulgaris]|nr:hypothetical protein DFH09DRAFT_1170781 [Mycena vulgaris]
MPKSTPDGSSKRSSTRTSPTRPRKKAGPTVKDRLVDLGRTWLWDAANRALMSPPDVPVGQRYSPHQKAGVLKDSFLTDPRSYPHRPACLAPTSSSYAKLRDLLARAEDQVEEHEDGCTEETAYYWQPECADELFKALIAVIEEHGIEGAGWKSARWEVYDAHSRYIQPLYHDKRENEWCDAAKDWLEGRLDLFDFGVLMPRRDSRSEFGRGYNAILPLLPPGQ